MRIQESENRTVTEQRTFIAQSFDAVREAFEQARSALPDSIPAASEELCRCLEQGGKILACGNGGSAAEAQHFTAELVGRFKIANRPAWPALALTSDTVLLTAWANDVSYEQVFARQVEAFGRPGDVLVGISTSGQSRNVIEALHAAKQAGLRSIAILGKDGGEMASLADIRIIVPSKDTARIQEVHLFVFHLLCELMEHRLVKER